METTVQYSERNWEVVLEKWCATQEQALHRYANGHPVLVALEDVLLRVGDAEAYSEAVSKYLRLVYRIKPGKAA